MPTDFQRPFAIPPGATELVLVRHGSVAYETAPDDPPLTDAGRRQAEAVAERLASEQIAGLFVTPLLRTRMSSWMCPLPMRMS